MYLKNILPHFFGNGFILCSLITAYLYLSAFHQPLDNKIRDFWFQSRGAVEVSGNITIVAIDENSIAALGQWPWERNKLSRILHNLDQAGALIIGMDIFFPEKDKTSPQYIAQQYQIDATTLPDYDKIFAETIARTPVVLGYLFDLDDVQTKSPPPRTNTDFKGNSPQSRAFIPVAHNTILNLPLFRDQAISTGFLNYLPDESGAIRSVPLIISYQNKIYSSMTFELFQLLNESPDITIHSAPTGITSLTVGDRKIITDAQGRLQLNFYGPRGSFEHLSAHAIYQGNFDKSKVKNKIILIGSTAAGLKDIRTTPFDVAAPGVEVHATALENLLQGDYVFRPDWIPGVDLSILLGITLLCIIIYPFIPAHIMLLVMVSGLYLIYLSTSQFLFNYGITLNILFPLLALTLFTVSSALINYYLESGLKKKIKSSFAKKLSASVVDDILKNDKEGVLIGRSKEVTVLFSDIRNFTDISEQLGTADKVIDMLNIYMTPMVEGIINASGTVDKLIGDAIMAYWNAPNPVTEHPDQAINTALQQLCQLKDVNKTLRDKYQLEINIGIGINTGTAIVGEMGSTGRSDYTAIGDTVNLASRLEGLCKTYGCQLIISEFTRQQLRQEWSMRELDLIRVKGKTQAVRVYEVFDPEIKPAISDHLDEYKSALSAYQQADFQTARLLFSTLNDHTPDPLYKLYIGRCQQYLRQPPKDFDGIFNALSK